MQVEITFVSRTTQPVARYLIARLAGLDRLVNPFEWPCQFPSHLEGVLKWHVYILGGADRRPIRGHACAENDPDESPKKWRGVFGGKFGATTVHTVVAAAEVRSPALDASSLDEVDAVRLRGLGALALNVLRPHWRRPPTWTADLIAAKVTVLAKIGKEEGGC